MAFCLTANLSLKSNQAQATARPELSASMPVSTLTELDGYAVNPASILLIDDGRVYRVRVVLGNAS